MDWKTLGLILKIVAAVLAVAGVVFVIVAYGDRIVAWFKRTFGKFFGCRCGCDCDCDCDDFEDTLDAADSDFEG